jgi:hypothetical protein
VLKNPYEEVSHVDPRHLALVKHQAISIPKGMVMFLGIFLIYVVLRCYAWSNTSALEDNDSIGFVLQIKQLLTFDLHTIFNVEADRTFFYAFWGALCSLPGWSVETGARLCSLLFSIVLFGALLKIGLHLAPAGDVAKGLWIVSISPVLILFSFSALSEPSYVATIYLGLAIFLTQVHDPRVWKAGVLGAIFGCGFLNRTEGILYIAVIPVLQAAYFLFWKRRASDYKLLARWTALFLVFFSLIAAPQIWFVSTKTGHFSFSSRQAWFELLNNPDGKSYDEKIFALDFSPSQINVYYLQDHPEILDRYTSQVRLKHYLYVFLSHFDEVYQRLLGVLIGPLGFVLFGMGLLALYQSEHRFEAAVVLVFIVVSLIPPLVYKVLMRYIAVIGPLIMLVEGIGIGYLSRSLTGQSEIGRPKQVLVAFLLVFAASAPFVFSLREALLPRGGDFQYRPAELRGPAGIVKGISRTQLQRTPVIVARHLGLAYLSEGRGVVMPYTDYAGLVGYCDLNHVDFVYLEYGKIASYPFLRTFANGEAGKEFRLVYKATDVAGRDIELYHFIKS